MTEKKLASICFKEEKVMKKKLAMVLTGVAVCGLLMVACQGKDKGAVADDVQTEGVDSLTQDAPQEAEPTPEAAEPEPTPEAAEPEATPEAGEAEDAGESEGEDTEDSAGAEPEAGAEGEDGSADVNAAENEEPQEEADTETKAN